MFFYNNDSLDNSKSKSKIIWNLNVKEIAYVFYQISNSKFEKKKHFMNLNIPDLLISTFMYRTAQGENLNIEKKGTLSGYVTLFKNGDTVSEKNVITECVNRIFLI